VSTVSFEWASLTQRSPDVTLNLQICSLSRFLLELSPCAVANRKLSGSIANDEV